MEWHTDIISYCPGNKTQLDKRCTNMRYLESIDAEYAQRVRKYLAHLACPVDIDECLFSWEDVDAKRLIFQVMYVRDWCLIRAAKY